MAWTQLRTDESTKPLEEFLQVSAEIGVEGTVLFGVFLFLYLLAGVIATTVVGLQTPYPFFSFEADPILLLDGTIVGIFTVQAAGSLLLYHFSVGVTDGSLRSVVLSFIGLGIGGALLQTTLPEVLEVFVSYI
jgi:hypothetical protein